MQAQCKRNLFTAYFIFLLTAVLIGCEDTTTVTSIEPTLTSLWTNVIEDTCSLNCHMPGGTEELGPDMSTKTLFFNNLVNKNINTDYTNWSTTNSQSSCKDIDFIEPSDVYRSTLVAGLISSYSQTFESTYAGCTSSYNLHLTNNVVISDTETENALVQWINDGALNN